MIRQCLNISAVIIIAFIMITVFMNYNAGYLDSDARGFSDFANRELEEHQLYDNGAESATTYEHGQDFSIAVRKTSLEKDSISEYRDRKIQEIIDSCEREYIRALIIDSASFISENGTVSFYIAYREYVVKKSRLSFYHSEVSTYLFDGNSGRSIDTVQALRKNYRSGAENFAGEYFESSYDKSKLNDAYMQYISASDANFDKFIIDGTEFVFFFDEGTVATSSEGVVSMFVPTMFMQDAQRDRILERYIDPSKPMVAVTYDDGPGGEPEMRILDTLSEYGSVATFFYLGERMSSSPETAKRAVQIGCEIGNHSWNHPQYSLMTEKEVREQINKTNEAIRNCCGVEPNIGRPPYGDFNDSTLDACKIPMVLWTVDTRDWATRNPEKIFDSVRKHKKLDGCIILMHSIYDETAKATDLIIPWLKENGYQTVTVSELIKYKTGNDPEEGKLYRELD